MWCNRDQPLGETLLARPGQRLHTVGQEGGHRPTTAPQAPELPALLLGMAWTVLSKSPYFSAASWPPAPRRFPCSKEVLMPTVLLVCLLTTETRCIFTTHIPTIVPRKVVPSLPPYLSLHVFLVPSPDKLSVSAPSHWADDFPKGEGHYCHPCWGLQWGCTGLLHGAD